MSSKTKSANQLPSGILTPTSSFIITSPSGELGALPAASLFKWDGVLKAYDLNALIETGAYVLHIDSTNVPDLPNGCNGSVALVFKIDNSNVHQIIIHRMAGVLLYRQMKNSIWFDWKQLAFV